MTTPSEPAKDPLIGRVLGGKFRVDSLIARGGMGAVYRAVQAPFERWCALKVLSPRVEDEERYEFQRRFLLEASTVARLTHPNTVTVFDYGRTEDGVLFLAMEFLEGRSLASALRAEGAFPQERALEITRSIARSLREAHSLGVVHRDIKPGNVFLTRHGDDGDFVKVIDFGLVKDVAGGEDDEQTQAGVMMGSPRYMAPEQIQGGTVDARTDVYALGIVLFEMLAGKVPFDRGSSMKTLMAHINEPPPSVLQINPASDVTPAIEQLLSRALAKQPDDRFASMGDLLVAIKEATGSSFAMTSSEHLPSTTGAHVLLPDGGVSSESIRPVAPLPPAPRSRAWMAAPVAAVALLALGLWSQRKEVAPAAPAAPITPNTPVEVASPSTPSAVEPAVNPPAPSAPEVTLERVISLVSEPSGVRVQRGEKGPEVCERTPCSITLRGEEAKEGTELSLFLSRTGYVARTVTFRVGSEPPTLKLNAVVRVHKENQGTPGVYRKDPYENPPY